MSNAIPDQSDILLSEMAEAYARYLRETIGADPRVQSARIGTDLREALTVCLAEAASPFDIAIERDPDDPRRINITVTPGPLLTVAAVVRR